MGLNLSRNGKVLFLERSYQIWRPFPKWQSRVMKRKKMFLKETDGQKKGSTTQEVRWRGLGRWWGLESDSRRSWLCDNLINIKIPRELVSKMVWRNFADDTRSIVLIVKRKSNILEKISLCRDHELGFRGIGSEMIQTKAIMSGIDIRLKVN